MNSAVISRTQTRACAGWLAGAMALFATHGVLAQEPVVDPPGRVARLSYIEGRVSLASEDEEGKEERTDAVINRPLTSGDKVWVENSGRAELQVGSSAIHLDQDTSLSFIELDDDVLQVSLTGGAATLRVHSLGEHETIRVETPNTTVRLLHPGEYHFEVDTSGDRTIVKTRSGEAEVAGRVNTYPVRANEEGEFTGLDNLTARIDRIEPRTAFESWANDRDRREDNSKSARYVSREVIGYEDLDDNGDWIDEPEYGHVWRPRYVAYDWAPYRYGHWAWVGPWGWTWVDDARWGFAPFHYGRWAYLSSRWCWVPGPRHLRPVYAPALVSWVGGPSVGISVGFGSGVGWFPLGPREIYVPGYRHTPRYVRYVNSSNTIIVNNNYFYDIDRGHYRNWTYRNRYPDAVTFVPRDRFVGGGRIGDNRTRIEDGQLRELRDNVRPPPGKELGDFRTVRRGLPGNANGNANALSAREQNSRVKDRDRLEIMRADESESSRPKSRATQSRSIPVESFQESTPRSYSYSGSATQPSKRDQMQRPPKQWSSPPSSSSGGKSWSPAPRTSQGGGGKGWSAPQSNSGGGGKSYSAPPSYSGGGGKSYSAPPSNSGGGGKSSSASQSDRGGGKSSAQPRQSNLDSKRK